MTVDVTSRQYDAHFIEVSDMKETYQIKFPKDVFNKFFACLKLPGAAVMKVSDRI